MCSIPGAMTSDFEVEVVFVVCDEVMVVARQRNARDPRRQTRAVKRRSVEQLPRDQVFVALDLMFMTRWFGSRC